MRRRLGEQEKKKRLHRLVIAEKKAFPVINTSLSRVSLLCFLILVFSVYSSSFVTSPSFFFLHSLSSVSLTLITLLSSIHSPVWQNWGDWQHTKSGLCQKVHPWLLLRRETEPSIWLVSCCFFFWEILLHQTRNYFSLPLIVFILILFLPQPTEIQ